MLPCPDGVLPVVKDALTVVIEVVALEFSGIDAWYTAFSKVSWGAVLLPTTISTTPETAKEWKWIPIGEKDARPKAVVPLKKTTLSLEKENAEKEMRLWSVWPTSPKIFFCITLFSSAYLWRKEEASPCHSLWPRGCSTRVRRLARCE